MFEKMPGWLLCDIYDYKKLWGCGVSWISAQLSKRFGHTHRPSAIQVPRMLYLQLCNTFASHAHILSF